VIVPTAAIEIVVAAIAAGGAVLGAAVGGVGSYFVERTLSDRRAAAVARAGARVVAADLKHVDDVLAVVEKDGKLWPFHKLPTPGWDHYRNDLALALEPDNWKSVSSTDRARRLHVEFWETLSGPPRPA
jgi:hypothetical protein